MKGLVFLLILLSNYSLETNTMENEPQTNFTLKKKILPVSTSGPVISKRRRRLEGGSPAALGEYPFMAELLYKLQPFCGASVISNIHLLTAAHCVKETDSRLLSAAVGTIHYDSKSEKGFGRSYFITSAVTHPLYTQHNFMHDLAILLLERPMKFDEHVNRICINANVVTPLYTRLRTAGWGPVNVGRDSSSSALIKSDLLSTNVGECMRYFKSGPKPNIICTKGTYELSCLRDSGRPLIVPTEQGSAQVGITSGRSDRECAGKPQFFTNVTDYVHWINSTTKKMDSRYPLCYV